MATLKVSSHVPSPSEDAEQLKSAFDGTMFYWFYVLLIYVYFVYLIISPSVNMFVIWSFISCFSRGSSLFFSDDQIVVGNVLWSCSWWCCCRSSLFFHWSDCFCVGSRRFVCAYSDFILFFVYLADPVLSILIIIWSCWYWQWFINRIFFDYLGFHSQIRDSHCHGSVM